MRALRDWFPQYSQDLLLLAVDLGGTFVFAVEGALAAIEAGLDLFGLMVLSFATALGGGIIRDLLIGATPPNSIRDWRYGATAFAGGGAVFFFYEHFQRVPLQLMLTLDAAGLSLFAVAGAMKALDFGIHPLLATLMGTMTGVGGGTVRDVLLNRCPGNIRKRYLCSSGADRRDRDAGGSEGQATAQCGDERRRGLLFRAANGCAGTGLESAEGDGSLAI